MACWRKQNVPWPADFSAWASAASPVVYSRVYHKFTSHRLAFEIKVELAEEGTQFAFLQAAKRAVVPQFFDDRLHFIRWLVKVAYRHGLDLLRRKKPTSQTECETLENPAK